MFKKWFDRVTAAKAYHAANLDAASKLMVAQAMRGDRHNRSGLGEIIAGLVEAVKTGRGKSAPIVTGQPWIKQSAGSL